MLRERRGIDSAGKQGDSRRGYDAEEIDRGPVAGDSAGMGEERPPPRGAGVWPLPHQSPRFQHSSRLPRGWVMTRSRKGTTGCGERGLERELVERASHRGVTPDLGIPRRQQPLPVCFLERWGELSRRGASQSNFYEAAGRSRAACCRRGSSLPRRLGRTRRQWRCRQQVVGPDPLLHIQAVGHSCPCTTGYSFELIDTITD